VSFRSISKLEAARRQLDWAIRLLLAGEDSVSTHTLAYASYCLLRDLRGRGPSKVLKKLEEKLKLREVPEFFKHAESDPTDILEEHSPKTAHLTIALAIALWKEHGQVETAAMREFSKLPDPYKPGHRASYVLTVAREEGPIMEERLSDIINMPSTGGPSILRKKKF
jgi:hypothetical protein